MVFVEFSVVLHVLANIVRVEVQGGDGEGVELISAKTEPDARCLAGEHPLKMIKKNTEVKFLWV